MHRRFEKNRHQSDCQHSMERILNSHRIGTRQNWEGERKGNGELNQASRKGSRMSVPNRQLTNR